MFDAELNPSKAFVFDVATAVTSVIDGDEIATIDCPTTPILLKDGDILIATTDGQSQRRTSARSIIIVGRSITAINLLAFPR